MDDMEFWGFEGEDGGLSMKDEWEGAEDLAAQLMEQEHGTQDTPALTALLYRTWATDTETMWAQGYPNLRLIVLTFPAVQIGNGAEKIGVVKELPVGHRDMASAETFAARFEKHVQDYIDNGWTRKDVTEVAR